MKKNDCCLMALGKKAYEALTRSEQKRVAIISGAWEVFLDKGFDVASMDEIAKSAGVSKRTVYSHFDSKETLFEGLMMAMCARKRSELSDKMDVSKPIEEVLAEFGVGFLHMLYEPEAMAMFRILVGQTNQFPEIGTEFFRHGPQGTLDMLSFYFSEQTEKGTIKVENAMLAASSFIGSIMGGRYIQCLITSAVLPDEAEINQTVDAAVQRFLHGVLNGKK